MLLTIFGNLVQQIMPHFVTQRALYEVRERPSKTYSWQVFMLSNIVVELPWNSLMAVIIFGTWYWPIGMHHNAQNAGQFTERTGLMFLLIWAFLMFTSTFTDMIIAGVESAENGGNIANLMFSLCLIFCGVLAGPSVLPRFWIFMYRLSPFTYLVDAMLSVGVGNTAIICTELELLTVDPPAGSTCAQYFEPYINATGGGYLVDKAATSACRFCSVSDTNVFLASFNASYDNRWRNFGIMWAYIVFNVAMAVFMYWLVRVPKGAKKEEDVPSEMQAEAEAEANELKKVAEKTGEKKVVEETPTDEPRATDQDTLVHEPITEKKE
jgi:ATP-binding cassette subfamily G (WHITE) protein 2 (PDR)